MHLFKEAHPAPPWCKLQKFQRFDLAADGQLHLPVSAPNARLMVTGQGWCLVSSGKNESVLRETQFLDIESGSRAFAVKGLGTPSTLILFEGDWGASVGSCGVFAYSAATPLRNKSDPVGYQKSTTFDSHYHDFDEYFLILEGRAKVVVGDQSYDVGPGDGVALGMGHHHDIPEISEPLRSAYFQSRLEGKKRLGHLWEHKNGPATPQPERR